MLRTGPRTTLAISSRSGSWHRATLALTVVLSLALAGPATADWLVTRDGARIETSGAWSEQGSLIVFSLPDGTLASMRASEVDLDASRRATEEARKPAATPAAETGEPVRRKATFVLKDGDVARATPPRGGADPLAPGDEPAAPQPPAAEPTGGERDPVQIVSWQDSDDPEGRGLILTGTARNLGDSVAAGLSVGVVLYDPDGKVLVTAPATVGADALAPGQSANFRVELPGTFTYSAVSFEVDYQPVRTTTTPPEAAATPGRQEP